MTSQPPSSDDTPASVDEQPEPAADTETPEAPEASETEAAAASESEPATAEPKTSAEPEADTSGRADIDSMTAMAEDIISRGAPWDARTSWNIVLGEGIVAALVGLLFIFKPLGGSSTTLQVVGLVLLVGSLMTAFQLWRHHLRPEIEQLASFRSGSGVTVGLVVIVATLFVPVTDTVVAALAVVVGIGFFIYGITGIGTSFVRMQLDVPLPLFTLVANAVLALAGLVLVVAGARGAGSVDGIFNLLGVLLIAGGLALAGYAYMLRQQVERR